MKTLIAVLAVGLAALTNAVGEEPAKAEAALVRKNGQLGYGVWGDDPAVGSDPILVIGAKPLPPPAAIIIKATTMIPLPADSTSQNIPAVRPTLTGTPVFVEPPVPAGALRPDSNGQILLPNKRPLDIASASDGLKNPWGIRIAPASSITDYELVVNGLVQGPKPVVIVNGQGLVRGERVGSFTLAEIRRGEVVMEYDGMFFVIPEGKKTKIRIPKE